MNVNSLKPPTLSKNHYHNLFVNHFQTLLHAALPSPAFHDHLRTYFRASLPPLRAPSASHSSDGTGMFQFQLPNRYLYKLGILPRYAMILSDLAYEQLGRLVRREWATSPSTASAIQGSSMMHIDGDEMLDQEDLWSHRTLDDARTVVKMDILAWLLGYLEAGNQNDRHRRNNIEIRLEHRLQMDFFDQK